MQLPRICALLVGAGLGGCAMLPTAGPTVRDIEAQQSKSDPAQFALIDIDEKSLATLASIPVEGFKSRFNKYGPPPRPTIGIGDTVAVTIWEASAGGLFTSSAVDHVSTGSHSATLPDQVVDNDGTITVPFAGNVPVAGLAPAQAQRAIERRLADKAIDPQVIVRVVRGVANSVTVVGEVGSAGRVPLTIRGDRLLDAIAAAGGARPPVHEILVRLSRDGSTATIPMQTLVSEPDENIYAQPGDVLTLVREPKAFLVFGAAGSNAQVSFGKERLSLAEALAKAGGLQDARSDPAGVFLFRFERPEVARALGRAIARAEASAPILYRLDLRRAPSYFLAQRFAMEDKDIIYIANAQLTELQKFFELLNTITAPVITGIVVRNAAP
jgi:polysaccharide export outer membrane protein